MSTSKIGKKFNPKKAVNPNYGKVEAPKKEEVDKLEQALTLLTQEVKLMAELVQAQNQALELVFQKIQGVEKRIFKLENDTKEVMQKGCEEILQGVSCKLEELKPAEEESKKKSWFK